MRSSLKLAKSAKGWLNCYLFHAPFGKSIPPSAPDAFTENDIRKEENLCLVNRYAILDPDKLCNYYETPM